MRRPPSLNQFIVRTLGYGFAIATVCVACLVSLFFIFGRDLPDHSFLIQYQPPSTTRVYNANFELINEHAHQKRTFVPIDKIPPMVKQAFISAEDKNFHYHMGLDVLGLLRALLNNIVQQRWGEGSGGSTITQQVAKNFLVGNERSLKRKIREAIMAFRLELTLPKSRILELYLNEIYLGRGTYGVSAAALHYFSKPLDALTPAQAAYLASLPKAPANYHPRKEPGKALKRRNWVLKRLWEDGVIDESTFLREAQTPLGANPTYGHEGGDYFLEHVRRIIASHYGHERLYNGGLTVLTTMHSPLQTYADKALQEGLELYDKRHGWRGPLENILLHTPPEEVRQKLTALYHTFKSVGEPALITHVSDKEATFTTHTQAKGTLALKGHEWLWPHDGSRTFRTLFKQGDVILIRASSHNPSQKQVMQLPQVTGGLVVMDADSGHVLALAGGYSHALSQFNSATQALRQTGSAFKPIVYAAALEHGFKPDSIIDDKPIAYDLGPGYGTYVPKNYAKRSYGPTPLRDGIIYSRNMMTVNLAARMGMAHVQKLAQNLGVVEAMPPHLSMSLGAGETSVLRLAAAYATLVNGGRKVTPTVIHTIYDHVGKKLEQTQPCFGLPPTPYTVMDWDKQGKHMDAQACDLREALLSPPTSDAITTMLRQTVEKGTARQLAVAAQALQLTLGGKTGTTNDFKDAWFVGFAENSQGRRLVVAVFVGYPYPKSLGQDENGSRVALPIFELFIHKAQEDIKRF